MRTVPIPCMAVLIPNCLWTATAVRAFSNWLTWTMTICFPTRRWVMVMVMKKPFPAFSVLPISSQRIFRTVLTRFIITCMIHVIMKAYSVPLLRISRLTSMLQTVPRLTCLLPRPMNCPCPTVRLIGRVIVRPTGSFTVWRTSCWWKPKRWYNLP